MLGFFGKTIFLSANLIERNCLSLKWEENNILLKCSTLCFKNIVFWEKNNVATSCREKHSAAFRSETKMLTPENTIAPVPLS